MIKNPKSKDWKSEQQFKEFYGLLKSTIIACWDPKNIKDAQLNLSQLLNLYSLYTDRYCIDCIPPNSLNKGIHYTFCTCEICREGKNGCEQNYCVCSYDDAFLILEKILELIKLEKRKLSVYFENDGKSYYHILFFYIVIFLVMSEKKLTSQEMIREWLNFYEKHINLISRIVLDEDTLKQLNYLYSNLEKEYHKNPKKNINNSYSKIITKSLKNHKKSKKRFINI